MVDSTWYVVVASRATSWEVDPQLPGATGSSGGWRFELLTPGPEVDTVDVNFDNDDGQTVPRP